MKRILLCRNGKSFYVRDTSKDMHTQYGFIKSKDLAKTGRVSSNTGKEFSIFTPSFIDIYRRIKRSAQIIPLKDVGFIIAETGIDSDSVVVDAGVGSGALACFLAHIAKEVTSYEIREDFIKIAEHNVELLGVCVRIKNKSIYECIDEKNVDLITLDVPEPWNALDTAAKALKPGGHLVSYSPSIPQTMDFVNALGDCFVHLKTSEIIERSWEIDGRKVRPMSRGIGHSGFISIARRI
ncbi:MAG: methyltransferase domain-containing protein [archaeon]